MQLKNFKSLLIASFVSSSALMASSHSYSASGSSCWNDYGGVGAGQDGNMGSIENVIKCLDSAVGASDGTKADVTYVNSENNNQNTIINNNNNDSIDRDNALGDRIDEVGDKKADIVYVDSENNNQNTIINNNNNDSIDRDNALGDRIDEVDDKKADIVYVDSENNNQNTIINNNNNDSIDRDNALGDRIDEVDDRKADITYVDSENNNQNTIINNNNNDSIDRDNALGGRIDQLDSKVDYLQADLNKKYKHLSKGIASAMAFATLAQPTEKGMKMVSLASGYYENESSVAIGFSGVTNDKVLFNKPVNYVWKIASTINFGGGYGGAGSVGVQWR